MIVGSIARRYAKALFDLAVEAGKVDAWAGTLVSLRAASDASPELRDLLENPVYTREQRQALAARLGASLGLDAELRSLLALLADRNRLAYLGGISDVFGRLADQKMGRVRARVTSAVPLTEAEASALAGKMAAATGATVLVERTVDPSLLGGVVAEVESLVYDGSLRSQLETLRQVLKR
jgi:F-type H+-transporting ATPase subunit delta